jgi:hypothetical protein
MESEVLARRIDELETAFTRELGKRGKIRLEESPTEPDVKSGTS